MDKQQDVLSVLTLPTIIKSGPRIHQEKTRDYAMSSFQILDCEGEQCGYVIFKTFIGCEHIWNKVDLNYLGRLHETSWSERGNLSELLESLLVMLNLELVKKDD